MKAEIRNTNIEVAKLIGKLIYLEQDKSKQTKASKQSHAKVSVFPLGRKTMVDLEN